MIEENIYIQGRIVYCFVREDSGVKSRQGETIYNVSKKIIMDFNNRSDTDEQMRIYAASYAVFNHYKAVFVDGKVMASPFDSYRLKRLLHICSHERPFYCVN